ncbi:MAG: DUF885 domain-containing protein [Phycisphaerales bacterium]|nr:DUF885 domain-containing protein [Planctomycetota bacterium]MCH8509215.1 DUF885 domain-containing protein [Phycisphaerales bacterium]
MIRTRNALPLFLVALALVLPPASGPAHAGQANRAESPLSPPVPEGRDPGLWAFMSSYLEALHERSPEWIGPTFNDERFNDRLGDVSAAAQEAWLERITAMRLELDRMPADRFSEPDRLDHDLLRHELDRQIAGAPFQTWQMPVNSQGGPQVWLPQLGDRVTMSTDKHRRDYLQRLKQIPIVVGDTIDNMRLGMLAGRVPPRAAVEPAVDQAMTQANPEYRREPENSPFYRPFLTIDQDSELARDARLVIADLIVPVYQELALFLQNEYLPACRDSVGISEGVDGPAAYDHALVVHTTLPDATAESIHQTGREQVARIRAEMMEVIARTDWEGNNAAWNSQNEKFLAFVDYLRTDPRFYFTEPEDLLNAYKIASKDIDAEMPRLFRRLPRLSYGVRAIPTFAARAAPTAYYYRGSLEAGIPAWFMANLTNLHQRPKYDIIALTLHEGVPGHHHQIALAQELENQHPLRAVFGFTAFVEGWALYAELLGLEVGGPPGKGLYADPYDDFGRLNFEMWRALRLVVDTGIHAMGWTRQDAIDIMTANSALTPHNITAEVDRYIGWPGQATGYMMGQLKIRELRARAEQRLGDRFDLRSFHDALLDAGAIPLPVLEAKIDRWIADQN